MAYSQAWLEDPDSIKGILAEVTVKDILGAYTTAGSIATLYISNMGYITTDGSVNYMPIIKGGLTFTESMSIDNATSLSFGDLELFNLNGELDDLLDSTKFIWVNKSVKVYLGDPFWRSANLTEVHDNFLCVFDGIIADIDSRSRDTINLKFRDKLQKLNTAITEEVIGTNAGWPGQTNQAELKPLVFGEVFNISPVLINPNNLLGPEYQINTGITEAVIEIRDNGRPVYNIDTPPVTGAIVNLNTGKFTLNYALYGTCTVSVQGVKNSVNLTTGALVSGVFNNNIANLIALIVTQYGKTDSKLSAAELDLDNLRDFATNNTAPVGIYVKDRQNVLVICQQLADSLGAQLFMTRQGKLQLLRIGQPYDDGNLAVTTISDRDILHHSLQVSNKTEVIAGMKIDYCKNWTVQEGLLTAIPEDHKTYFAKEYLSSSVSDTLVSTNYILEKETVPKATLLLNKINADTEAQRLLTYFKTPRLTYSFTGTSRLLGLKLGQPVTLTHNRFGLSGGKTGQVISLSPNWLKSTIEVEVLI